MVKGSNICAGEGYKKEGGILEAVNSICGKRLEYYGDKDLERSQGWEKNKIVGMNKIILIYTILSISVFLGKTELLSLPNGIYLCLILKCTAHIFTKHIK